jgi:hypothetical protein
MASASVSIALRIGPGEAGPGAHNPGQIRVNWRFTGQGMGQEFRGLICNSCAEGTSNGAVRGSNPLSSTQEGTYPRPSWAEKPGGVRAELSA